MFCKFDRKWRVLLRLALLPGPFAARRCPASFSVTLFVSFMIRLWRSIWIMTCAAVHAASPNERAFLRLRVCRNEWRLTAR